MLAEPQPYGRAIRSRRQENSSAGGLSPLHVAPEALVQGARKARNEKSRVPYPVREVTDFHKREAEAMPAVDIDFDQGSGPKALLGAGFAGNRCGLCTKSGQRAVDGVHSIENTMG